MDVIPFNVPGLPEGAELASQFVLKPITVDATDIEASGPLLGFRHGPAPASPPDPQGDGVLCIYPDVETIACLYNCHVLSGPKDVLPAVVVNLRGTDEHCAILAFSTDLNGNPMLIVNIIPDEYLANAFGSYDGTTIIDLSGIDDRLEITQIFTCNAFGVITRIANDVTKVPKEDGHAVFKLYDDTETVADVCSCYLTTLLKLGVAGAPAAGSGAKAEVGDPIFALLWKPVTWAAVAAFSAVYVLVKTSISVRRANGQLDWSIDYNRNANLPPPPPPQNRN
jgi:hypothetical protein